MGIDPALILPLLASSILIIRLLRLEISPDLIPGTAAIDLLLPAVTDGGVVSLGKFSQDVGLFRLVAGELTLQDLDEAIPSDRRNLIFKSLFPLVLASPTLIESDHKKTDATLITNMLMDKMDNKSIINVLYFPKILNSKIIQVVQAAEREEREAAEREERAQRARDLEWFGDDTIGSLNDID